jgi:hypothetical protein
LSSARLEIPFFFAESVGEEPFLSPLSSSTIVFSARVFMDQLALPTGSFATGLMLKRSDGEVGL